MFVRFRSILPLIALGLTAAGCQPGPAGTSATGPSRFAPRTTGSSEELLAHLRGLKELRERMKVSDSGDLQTTRESQRLYSEAVVATADALLAAKDATPPQRREAAEAELSVLRRRMEDDPRTIDRILTLTDRLAKEPAELGLAPIAAYHRVRALLDTPVSGPSTTPANEARLDQLIEAAIRLGRAEPTHPEAAKMLADFAPIAEANHRDERARALYELLARRSTDPRIAKFAAGGAARISLKTHAIDDFSGPNLDGSGSVDLKSYRGKVVLIDFWATWCGPCRAEMPALKALRERLGPRGFEVLGITLDEGADEPRDVVKSTGMNWPQIHDTTGAGGKSDRPSLAERFGVMEIPLKMLIDREGRYIAAGHGLADVMEAVRGLFPEPEVRKGQ